MKRRGDSGGGREVERVVPSPTYEDGWKAQRSKRDLLVPHRWMPLERICKEGGTEGGGRGRALDEGGPLTVLDV